MARASRYESLKGSILEVITFASRGHSKAPSVRALAEQFEVSTSTMHSFLTKMAKEGLIEWTPGRHRSLRPTDPSLAS